MTTSRPPVLCLLLAALVAGRAAGAPAPSPEDLADRAREVLQKHCLSCHHLLRAGKGGTPDLWRDALVRALNHLTWKKEVVTPTAIEPTGTVFRIDLDQLGWDERPFQVRRPPAKDVASPLNLFDLVLL